MQKYFNINLEFSCESVDSIIENTIQVGGKGYVCSVEGNILCQANKNIKFNKIVNNALVNICDGSSIALLSSLIYRKKLHTYVGADLFIDYIKNKNYSYIFLGNTSKILNGLKNELMKLNPKIKDMHFIPLPFKNVDEFDYLSISNEINSINADIIWVSLGAPKQEEFMFKLLPFLNRGVMFGFGAIFNFYSGIPSFKRSPIFFRKLHAEWIYRLIQEPKKQIFRVKEIIYIIPKIVFQELHKNCH